MQQIESKIGIRRKKSRDSCLHSPFLQTMNPSPHQYSLARLGNPWGLGWLPLERSHLLPSFPSLQFAHSYLFLLTALFHSHFHLLPYLSIIPLLLLFYPEYSTDSTLPFLISSILYRVPIASLIGLELEIVRGAHQSTPIHPTTAKSYALTHLAHTNSAGSGTASSNWCN